MTATADGASRLDGLTSWHAAGWRGLRVAVLGLGASGFAAADTLAELGAVVTVHADGAPADRVELLELIGVGFVDGGLDDAPPPTLVADPPDVVIVSPGIPPSNPTVRWAREHSTVWGDVELAWRVRDKTLRDGRAAAWILITGTNGKTTTTQLVDAMLREGGLRSAACGNIGVPVLDAVRDPQGFDVLAVELSSHQLHALPTSGDGALVPLASACLNIADDHLAWHGSAEAYRAAKAKVYANTVIACVYNTTDPVTRTMVEEADVVEGCRAVGFGPGVPAPGDVGIVDDVLCDRAFLDDRRNTALELAQHEDLVHAGLDRPHMTMNVLAAAALARACGVLPEAIRRAVRSFHTDHHRTELVAARGGIAWVDDSKATNPHAAAASLSAFDHVVWLLGGQFKGVDIDDLIARFGPKTRAAIIIGVDRAPVLEAFARHAPDVPLHEVIATDTDQVMPEAVRHAAGLAQPGDTVLLAPAAASFDQFDSYGDRGARFAEAVRQLVGGNVDGESADQSPDDGGPGR